MAMEIIRASIRALERAKSGHVAEALRNCRISARIVWSESLSDRPRMKRQSAGSRDWNFGFGHRGRSGGASWDIRRRPIAERMEMGRIAEELSADLRQANDKTELGASLGDAAKAMGFDHFALSCGDRFGRARGDALLLHDYPQEWARVYVAFGLAGADPVRRACERSFTGFAWSCLGQMIPMTDKDRKMLSVGRECGLGDGYTVPRHLPAGLGGSCTFAVRPGSVLPDDMLFVAEIVGGLALASALRLSTPSPAPQTPVLSDRQRECVLWSARGKTAGETATILGIGPETVIQHLKVARERYGVHCGQSLIICALFDGLIGFGDIFETWGMQ